MKKQKKIDIYDAIDALQGEGATIGYCDITNLYYAGIVDIGGVEGKSLIAEGETDVKAITALAKKYQSYINDPKCPHCNKSIDIKKFLDD